MTVLKEKNFCDVTEAAERAGMSIRHFRRVYFDQDHGAFFAIRRKFFVKLVDLEAWLRRRKKAS